MDYVPKPPLIRTPFSDFGTIFGTISTQTHGRPQCKRFELKYLDCMDAYGLEKGSDRCGVLFEDFYECLRCNKQEWRQKQLRAEREKKYKEGELEKKYPDPPAPEIMFPIKF